MKFLHYFYYRIYETFIKISDDALNNLKPFALIGLLEIQIIFQILVWFSIITKLHFGIDPVIGAVVGIILMIPNYFIFPYKKIIREEAKEFEHYPKTRKVLWNTLTIAIILGVFTFTVFSFHELGQVTHR
ncbi:MAG TPA: hypothetical protein VNY36_06960 [Bacteroidia bacterium]|jgi:hypothetical protein|nr:hypothetical protein [Bacteroidia bacterium]